MFRNLLWLGSGSCGDFVTPVVDTMSESLVNVTWPDPIQYASLSKLCIQNMYAFLLFSVHLLTQKDVVTQGRVIASYSVPSKLSLISFSKTLHFASRSSLQENNSSLLFYNV